MILSVRVKPSSSQEKIEFDGQILTVWLRERAKEDEANQALVALLKKTFGSARLVSGFKSKTKKVEIPPATIDEVARTLQGSP